jgi:ubiquinol-cytochrome c reductase cytochrome b subunit
MTDTAVKPRTKREQKAANGPYGRLSKAINEADERFGVAKGGRVFLDKIFPDHWSFMLGEIALYSFIVLVATGIFLCLYYVPSSTDVVYHGVYAPLRGQHMSEAYASTVDLSFIVRGGLFMRQMHHWACDVFLGAIVIHMARIFFTGAFRKPRETNWLIGVTLLILAIVNGFIGYSLPDDLISGTGIRIAYGIILSIPIVGSYLAFWLFGGSYPGTAIIPRFFTIHVLILPAIIAALIGAHLGLLVRQKHTQFPGKGRTERNVIGTPMYPAFIAKTTGFLFMCAGVIGVLAAAAQINPIWQFGPYRPYNISYAVQPDWYMGWLDGALRIMPSWETVLWHHTIPWEVFLPAVVFPGLIFTICLGWPIIERAFTKDDELHNLLDRPRDRPKRTAAGAAMIGLLFTLFCASSTDVLANFFHVSLNATLWFFRIAVIVVPILAGLVTHRICLEMQGVRGIGKRKRANIVIRTATGEYVTTPVPLHPGDDHHELEPEPVPTHIELEPVGARGNGGPNGGPDGGPNGAGRPDEPTGVRTVTR